jgi:hypothetical protein
MWVTYSTHGNMWNVYKSLMRKCLETVLLERPRGMLEDVIKMDPKLIWCESMSWIHGSLETIGGLLRIWQQNLKDGEFLDQLSDSRVKLCFIKVAYCSLKLNRSVILLLVLKVRYYSNNLPTALRIDESGALLFGSLRSDIHRIGESWLGQTLVVYSTIYTIF